MALRSARRLLREGRLRRLMLEVDSRMRWRLHVMRNATRPTIDDTLKEVHGLLAGWRCTSACDGTPYVLPTHFDWGRHATCPNVYCVAPDVSDVDNAG